MTDFMKALGVILPWIVAIFSAYLLVVIAGFFGGIIKYKKKDPTLKLLMNGFGYFVFSIMIPALVGTTIYSFYQFFTTWNLEAFNATALAYVAFVYSFQDIFFAGRNVVVIGNKKFETRKFKSVKYPGKKKLIFVYGTKEYKIPLRFVHESQLKRYIK